jgi:hypothetical protein
MATTHSIENSHKTIYIGLLAILDSCLSAGYDILSVWPTAWDCARWSIEGEHAHRERIGCLRRALRRLSNPFTQELAAEIANFPRTGAGRTLHINCVANLAVRPSARRPSSAPVVGNLLLGTLHPADRFGVRIHPHHLRPVLSRVEELALLRWNRSSCTAEEVDYRCQDVRYRLCS